MSRFDRAVEMLQDSLKVMFHSAGFTGLEEIEPIIQTVIGSELTPALWSQLGLLCSGYSKVKFRGGTLGDSAAWEVAKFFRGPARARPTHCRRSSTTAACTLGRCCICGVARRARRRTA